MAGSDGTDRLTAAIDAAEATAQGTLPMGLDLRLAARKPPAFHDRDGWIDFGPGGGSYYYSRTDMAARGTLKLDNTTFQVDGSAWFDHQWGDFISVGGGGWDWFAVNLDDGTDLTLSLVRDADGSYPLIYGTMVRPNGTTEHLDRDAFTVDVTGTWTSPSTGATYPAGWSIHLPDDKLTIDLAPTVADQELDTRGDDRRHLLGGLTEGHGEARAGSRRRRRGRGVRRADRLRAGSVGAHRVRGATDALSDQPGAVSGGRSRPAVVASARVWASRPARRSSTASIRVAPSLYARSLVIDAVNASWAMRSIDP